MGLRLCTLVLEFNYSEPKTSLGSVWMSDGDKRPDLDSETPLAELSGWVRVVGPIDYEEASAVNGRLREFLRECGVTVVDEGVAD